MVHAELRLHPRPSLPGSTGGSSAASGRKATRPFSNGRYKFFPFLLTRGQTLLRVPPLHRRKSERRWPRALLRLRPSILLPVSCMRTEPPDSAPSLLPLQNPRTYCGGCGSNLGFLHQSGHSCTGDVPDRPSGRPEGSLQERSVVAAARHANNCSRLFYPRPGR